MPANAVIKLAWMRYLEHATVFFPIRFICCKLSSKFSGGSKFY